MDNILTKHRSFWICLALTLATAAVFWQVCTYDFVNYDDPDYVYKNPNIQAGITLKTIKWAFSTNRASNWHPLTWLSHILDWQLFGPNPAGHHLTNLIIHIVNTLLLFIVLKRMTRVFWPSAFVAALFALHPLHVESVAWVSERKDVLSTFFWMLTMWAYVRFVGRPNIARYLLVVVFFALGLMAKPMLVTLPFVLLLLDYWPLERFSSKRSLPHLLVEKIPLFAMALASCIVTFIAQKETGAMSAGGNCGFLICLANAFISYMRYIIKMIWPARLAMFYPHPRQNIPILYVAISVAVLVAVTILVLRFAKNRRYLFTGWFWYLGTLVPVIGLIQVGAHAMADRYSYITLTGLFIIIAWGLPDLLAKWRYKKIALALSALLTISAMSTCTYFQLRYWQNSTTLFQHALDVTKDNYVAHLCIAGSLREQRKLDEAIYHCSEAVRLNPYYLDAQINLAYALQDAGRLDKAVEELRKYLQMRPNDPDVLSALGNVLSQQGKFDEAAEAYQECLQIKPDEPNALSALGNALSQQNKFDEAVREYRKCLQMRPNDPNTLNALGVVLGCQGKFDEAVKYFNEALRIKPDFVEAHTNLGFALSCQGKHNEAAVHLAESLRLDPNSVLAHYHIGQVLVQMGKIDDAITHFEEALRLKPDWVEPMNNAACLLAANQKTTVRNPDRAVKLAQRACELTNYKKPQLLDTLAVAYAAAGNFDKAVETAEKALELCQSSEQKTLKEEIKNRLVLYKAGKPYIEAQ